MKMLWMPLLKDICVPRSSYGAGSRVSGGLGGVIGQIMVPSGYDVRHAGSKRQVHAIRFSQVSTFSQVSAPFRLWGHQLNPGAVAIRRRLKSATGSKCLWHGRRKVSVLFCQQARRSLLLTTNIRRALRTEGSMYLGAKGQNRGTGRSLMSYEYLSNRPVRHLFFI
jgi:hypothetical protein